YKEEDNYYAICKYFYVAKNPTITGFFKMDVTYNDAKDQYELYAKEWLHRPQSPTIWWYMNRF
ncbi:MAG: hypothetical protein LBE76_07950, partial [Nitrososphaerota archaeon]|nr:hypothetical protein [Nitrososphaerota archaeon]